MQLDIVMKLKENNIRKRERGGGRYRDWCNKSHLQQDRHPYDDMPIGWFWKRWTRHAQAPRLKAPHAPNTPCARYRIEGSPHFSSPQAPPPTKTISTFRPRKPLEIPKLIIIRKAGLKRTLVDLHPLPWMTLHNRPNFIAQTFLNNLPRSIVFYETKNNNNTITTFYLLIWAFFNTMWIAV